VDTQRIKRLAKEGFWVVLGQVGTVIGSLVLVRVLTEFLTPEQYGELSLALTISTLVTQVIMGGLIAGVGRHYIVAYEQGDLIGYLNQSLTLLIFATLATLALGVMLAIGAYLLGRQDWIVLIVAAIMFATLSGYSGTLSGIQNAARQRAVVALHNSGNAWLKIGLAALLLTMLDPTAESALFGYCLAILVICLSQVVFLQKKIRKIQFKNSAEKYWVKKIWAFSWPFSFWGVFTWAHQVSDRWSLQYFASPTDVGEYAVLFQIGYTPLIIMTATLMSFIGPILYEKSGDGSDNERNSETAKLGWGITLLGASSTVGVTILAFFLHENIFRYVVASQYREISHLLPGVIFAGGIFASGQVLALKLMSDMNSRIMMRSKITTACLGVFLNIGGAYYAGIFGVVVAMCVFSIIFFLWSMHLAAR
jgi:O-antigen/teichoic acid export membrane protein